MSDMVKSTLLWLVIIGVVVAIFSNLDRTNADADQLNYSSFVTAVSKGEIKEVKIDGEEISGTKVNGSEFETVRPAISDDELMPLLREHNVEVQGTMPERQGLGSQLLIAAFRFYLLSVYSGCSCVA